MEKLTPTERRRRFPTRAVALSAAALTLVACGLANKKPGAAPSPKIVAECDGSSDTWMSVERFEFIRDYTFDVPKTAYHLGVTKQQVEDGMVGSVFCPTGVPDDSPGKWYAVKVNDFHEYVADVVTNPCLVIGDYPGDKERYGVLCPGVSASKSPSPRATTEDPWDQPTPYDYPTDEPYSGFPTDDVYGV